MFVCVFEREFIVRFYLLTQQKCSTLKNNFHHFFSFTFFLCGVCVFLQLLGFVLYSIHWNNGNFVLTRFLFFFVCFFLWQNKTYYYNDSYPMMEICCDASSAHKCCAAYEQYTLDNSLFSTWDWHIASTKICITSFCFVNWRQMDIFFQNGSIKWLHKGNIVE